MPHEIRTSQQRGALQGAKERCTKASCCCQYEATTGLQSGDYRGRQREAHRCTTTDGFACAIAGHGWHAVRPIFVGVRPAAAHMTGAGGRGGLSLSGNFCALANRRLGIHHHKLRHSDHRAHLLNAADSAVSFSFSDSIISMHRLTRPASSARTATRFGPGNWRCSTARTTCIALTLAAIMKLYIRRFSRTSQMKYVYMANFHSSVLLKGSPLCLLMTCRGGGQTTEWTRG